MRIAVVGTGYVGLVAGAGFSDFGHTVSCLDIDSQRIKQLETGIVPFYEPQLEELISRNTAQKRLIFTSDPDEAIAGTDVIFLAVGTPRTRPGPRTSARFSRPRAWSAPR